MLIISMATAPLFLFASFIACCVFRGRPATHFGVIRPAISASSGHQFRCDPVSRFGVVRPSFSFFVSDVAA
jgi:hypothetical protein